MEKTILAFDNKNLEYTKTDHKIIKKDNFFIIILTVFVIFFLSICYSLLINFEWQPLKTLEKFKRIKKNMNSWTSIVNEKTGIEINKGRYLYLTKPSVSDFQCIDYGSYYVPGRISSSTYLPEFVRRGGSGPWVINKADEKDLSSLQFCKFLLNKYITKSSNLDNLITCGIDMFDKIGYSGYFMLNSPCDNIKKY
jgi:hypothetical protein